MDADLDLKDRLAVVTGASAGIGESVARRLAGRGMALALGARRRDRVEALAEELARVHGIRAWGLPLDVTDAGSVGEFARQVEDRAGAEGVYALVNNAGKARGVARIPSAGPEDEDDWAEMLDTNVMGLLRVTRCFIGGMVERRRGHVVNLGSLAGIETYEGGAVYCATKAAVRVISKALRYELLGSDVRVTCVNPGLVETEFSVVRLGDQARADAVYAGMTPCTGDDVAATVEWVLALPAHVNIEELQVQPTDQASAQRVHRRVDSES